MPNGSVGHSGDSSVPPAPETYSAPESKSVLTFGPGSALLIIGGVVQILVGLYAMAHDDWLIWAPDIARLMNLSAWGWTFLILGVLSVLVGLWRHDPVARERSTKCEGCTCQRNDSSSTEAAPGPENGCRRA